MRISKKMKKNGILLFSCLFLFSLILSVFSGGFIKLNAKGAGPDISYTYDFTAKGKNEAGNDAWQEDLYIDPTTGKPACSDTLIIPSTKNCLATGDGNLTLNEGYLIYNFNAGAGKAFTSLNLFVAGRVFHHQHEAECDSCFMKLYIGESADDLKYYTKVSAAEDGTFTVYAFDLMQERKEIEEKQEVDDDWWITSESNKKDKEEPETDTESSETVEKDVDPVSAKGYEQCFIKIVLSGHGDWVCIEKIFVEGETSYVGYADPTFDTEEKGDAVHSVGDEVTLRPVSVYIDTDTEDKTFDSVERKVIAPDGTEKVFADGEESFTVESTGAYEVTYTVYDESRVYTDGYIVYGVKNADDFLTADKVLDGETGKPKEENNLYVWDKSAFMDESNYLLSANSSIRKTEKGFYVNGTASSALKADFSTGVNVSFDIQDLSGQGAFEFALVKEVGEINFDTKDKTGLYFKAVLHEGGNVLLTGFYSDEKGIASLGGYVFKNAIGKHGLGIKQRTATDVTTADGAEVYFDGERYSSYYTAVSVFLSKIAPSGNVFVGFRCTTGATVEILNLVPADSRSPELLTLEGDEFAKNGMVGDRYYLPKYTVFDKTDGVVNYTITVKDPNGKEHEIEEDLNGEYFEIEFKGRYSVVFNSFDYSGAEMEVTKNVTTKLKDGAPEFTFKTKPTEIARKGTAFDIPTPTVKAKKLDEQGNVVTDDKDKAVYETWKDAPVGVRVTNPSGGEIEVVKDPETQKRSFTPTTLGVYTVLYSVENGVATTQELFEVTVKLDVEPEESQALLFESESWKGAYTEEFDNGLCVFGTTYSEYPFEMSGGIEFTLDLRKLVNKKEKDGWISLGIGSVPKAGGFGDTKEGYLYFMFYREDSNYYCNVNFHAIGAESAIGIFGPEDLGTTGFATISIAKITDSDTYDDNVNLYVNRKKIAYGTEKSIVYSDIVDDENYTYLSFYSFGSINNPMKNNSLLLKSVSTCDLLAPTVRMRGTLPEKVVLNEVVTMPKITLSDGVNDNFQYTVGLYAPSGKKVDFSNGAFKAEEEGTYHLVIKAYDESGNTVMERYEIQVETPVWVETLTDLGENWNPSVVIDVLFGAVFGVCILFVGILCAIAILIVVRLKKKLYRLSVDMYYSKGSR